MGLFSTFAPKPVTQDLVPSPGDRQPVPAVSRSTAQPAATSSAAGSEPAKPAAAPAADDVPKAWRPIGEADAGNVPYAKGAGSYRAPGETRTTKTFSPGPTSRPATPAAIAAEPPKVTLVKLVDAFVRHKADTAYNSLKLGYWAHQWVTEQSDRAPECRLDRQSALRHLREELAKSGVDRKSYRVDRYIRCYHVAELFDGWEPSLERCPPADSVSYSAIREMQPLVERDKKTEVWRIVPAYAAAAQTLWNRLVAERLSAEAVRREVLAILPRKTLSLRRRKPIKLAFVLKYLPRLSAEDLARLEERVKAERSKTLLSERTDAA